MKVLNPNRWVFYIDNEIFVLSQESAADHSFDEIVKLMFLVA